MITPSRRLQRLPQYVIAELAAMKRALAAAGADVIDLSRNKVMNSTPQLI